MPALSPRLIACTCAWVPLLLPLWRLQLCRQNGLGRWPYRARQSLKELREKMRVSGRAGGKGGRGARLPGSACLLPSGHPLAAMHSLMACDARFSGLLTTLQQSASQLTILMNLYRPAPVPPLGCRGTLRVRQRRSGRLPMPSWSASSLDWPACMLAPLMSQSSRWEHCTTLHSTAQHSTAGVELPGEWPPRLPMPGPTAALRLT